MPITQQELARRLRAAREACRLKQEDVARHLGVSRPTIAQLELGNRTVSSLELDKLAYLFGRGIGEFLAEAPPEVDAVQALFRLHPKITGLEVVQAALRRSMTLGRELTNLEHLLGIERDRRALPVYPVPNARSRWDSVRQGEQAAVEERRRLQLGDAPLPDLVELLENQGIRIAQIEMPEDLSGITLFDSAIGPFVVVNNRAPKHSPLRRRFSLAHEYCHVLLDKDQKSTISLSGDKENHLEVRANAFAACFLMPTAGVQDFMRGLGKGRTSRLESIVFDEEDAQHVNARSGSGTQTIQLHDLVLLAHHFGVSCQVAMYRLKNTGLLSRKELDELTSAETEGQGRKLAQLLGIADHDENTVQDDFRRRFLALALEAFRREEITLAKLRELAGMVGVSTRDLGSYITAPVSTKARAETDSGRKD
jgi:Zn-dependent peptidase ImmA (M78 family)/transcriptional regulator with XRE-family HTH domain